MLSYVDWNKPYGSNEPTETSLTTRQKCLLVEDNMKLRLNRIGDLRLGQTSAINSSPPRSRYSYCEVLDPRGKKSDGRFIRCLLDLRKFQGDIVGLEIRSKEWKKQWVIHNRERVVALQVSKYIQLEHILDLLKMTIVGKFVG